jgi:hypothetical protein
MYKFAVCGKANSGKDTTSNIICESIIENFYSLPNHKLHGYNGAKTMALADPIKEMIRIMFPHIPRKHLYGPSKYRLELIPGAFKDGKPLTIRQLLMDLGTGLGRNYNSNIWLENIDLRLEKEEKKNRTVVVVTDVRFRNEFDHFKKNGFQMIKLIREDSLNINHVSETQQDSIKDDEFSYVINNNGSLEDLKKEIFQMIHKLG